VTHAVAMRQNKKATPLAIFHLSVKPVSRASGRTATAAAAYRAGIAIADERTGQLYDYTRKRGVESADMVLPDGAPEWATHRAKIWNAAEHAEKRKDACVAREFVVALPAELSRAERRRLVIDFAKEMADNEGCAVDVAIHAPGKEGDHRNHHAHILRTTRKVGADGLTEKLDTEKAGRKRMDDLGAIRVRWAELTNERLRENGINARIDPRSLKAQAIEREPTSHLGPSVTALARRGDQSDVLDRIAAAKAAGDRTRADATAPDHSIIATGRDLAAALAEKERQDGDRAAAFERIDQNFRHANHAGRTAGRTSKLVDADLRAVAEEHRAIEIANRSIEQALAQRAAGRNAEQALAALGRSLERAHQEIARAAKVIYAEQEAKRIHTQLPPKPKEATDPAVAARSEATAERPEAQIKEAAYQALVAELQGQGKDLRPVKENKGRYIGRVELSKDGRFAIQELGRGTVTIHDLAKLEGSYSSGQRADITYRDGRGTDKLQGQQQERSRDLGHSR
jgi:hypothetical protein